MTRVDTRDVIERAEDIASTAQFELRTGVRVNRCECGASVLRVSLGLEGFVCAGCSAPVNLQERFVLHPAPVASAAGATAVGEVGAGRGPVESSTSPGGTTVRRWVAARTAAWASRLAPTIFRDARRDPECDWCGEDGHTAADCSDHFRGER